MTIIHRLKTDPTPFEAVHTGKKTFEIRANDRGFQVGDALRLLETKYSGAQMRDGLPLEYTGREMLRTISHVLEGYGLQPGWCILSLAPLPQVPAGCRLLPLEPVAEMIGAMASTDATGNINGVPSLGIVGATQAYAQLMELAIEATEYQPRMTLDACQLRHAAEFAAADYEMEEDQRGTEMTFQRLPVPAIGTDGDEMPAGMYCWYTEYPEEGALHLETYDEIQARLASASAPQF
jgi:hypothetical protein